MKRFLIKLTGLLLIMAVIFTGYDAAYRRICGIDPTQNDEYKFQNVPEGIQVCNFGSSHGRDDFDYSMWQDAYTTFNFALVMQTASYDYRILQQYIGMRRPWRIFTPRMNATIRFWNRSISKPMM